MTDYNFIKNYENIKTWEFKSQLIPISNADNYFDYILNLFKSYPKLILLIKTRKILYLPTLFVMGGVFLIEISSLFPLFTIKKLQTTHYEYEDTVIKLNEINRNREENFNTLKKYSTLLSNPSPSYLFGFYLQESLPRNIQLLDYLVDNYGFKLNAVSMDLVSTNKFISLLLENKLIDKESIKINRIINQSNNNENSIIEQNVPNDLISIEISGKLVHLPLKERIKSYRESSNIGKFKKFSTYSELIELIK